MPPLSYTNRKGETKYLRAVRASKGGTRYYVISDPGKYDAAELVTEAPAGFEWYEYPYDGKIVWRKAQPTRIRPEEREIVRSTAQSLSPYPDLYLDTEPDALVLHFCRSTAEGWGLTPEQFQQYKFYDPVLVFAKLPDGQWQVQRQCHFPGLDGWIPLETGPDLQTLAVKYTPHIGQETLLDFWIDGEKDF